MKIFYNSIPLAILIFFVIVLYSPVIMLIRTSHESIGGIKSIKREGLNYYGKNILFFHPKKNHKIRLISTQHIAPKQFYNNVKKIIEDSSDLVLQEGIKNIETLLNDNKNPRLQWNRGLNKNEMTIGIIGVVSIINLLFLTFLHLKQPTY